MAWKYRIKLKDALDVPDGREPGESDFVAEAARKIHTRLEGFRQLAFPDDSEIEDVSDNFHTIAFVDGPANCADINEFDAVMNALYDWADDARVWID